MPPESKSQNPGFPGAVAEWLCSGLQLRVRRFDSDPSLQFTFCVLTSELRARQTPAHLGQIRF